jgi:hypothetical protein
MRRLGTIGLRPEGSTAENRMMRVQRTAPRPNHGEAWTCTAPRTSCSMPSGAASSDDSPNRTVVAAIVRTLPATPSQRVRHRRSNRGPHVSVGRAPSISGTRDHRVTAAICDGGDELTAMSTAMSPRPSARFLAKAPRYSSYNSCRSSGSSSYSTCMIV